MKLQILTKFYKTVIVISENSFSDISPIILRKQITEFQKYIQNNTKEVTKTVYNVNKTLSAGNR